MRRGKKDIKDKKKRANIDHVAHQVGVTGVGAHKNKKKEANKYLGRKKVVYTDA